MTPKVIKTNADYEAALARIEEIFDATPGTDAGNELELLSFLVENYEDEHFPMSLPDPITAIRFRMEQQNLKQKDLVQYIGSPSKVSEVLNGQRSLSLPMIRNLATGLGIPAEVLMQQPDETPPSAVEEAPLSQYKFPLGEMVKRRWIPGFSGTLPQLQEQKENLLQAFMAPFVQQMGAPSVACALNRHHVRSDSAMDEHALAAWRIRVITVALRDTLPPYKAGSVTSDFITEVARLSYFDEGPRLAKEFLNKNGIHFVVERHLPKTFLDGAALRLPDGSPLIALTLRHDRLDNFWFTLGHELAHIALHLDRDDVDAFFDDLTIEGTDQCEQEADAMTREALIPAAHFASSNLSKFPTPTSVRIFAEQIRVSPSIPAGRVRFETKNFRILNELLGNGKVRSLFEDSHC